MHKNSRNLEIQNIMSPVYHEVKTGTRHKDVTTTTFCKKSLICSKGFRGIIKQINCRHFLFYLSIVKQVYFI